MHMGLPHFKGQALVKGIAEQEALNWTGIDPGYTDHTATADGHNTLM